MNLKRRQRGMSFWMILFVLVVLGIAFFVSLKLIPIYMESFKVDRIISGLVNEPGVGSQSRHEIAATLVKRFDIDDVRRFNEKTLRKYVDIQKRGERVTILVEYRAEAPLVGNVSLVADFKKRASN